MLSQINLEVLYQAIHQLGIVHCLEYLHTKINLPSIYDGT